MKNARLAGFTAVLHFLFYLDGIDHSAFWIVYKAEGGGENG